MEDFISQFGDSGFVLVALGSIVSMIQSKEIIKEMNSAFAHLPQGVLWTCKSSHWPKDVSLAPNVKIMDWLPQIDLLGKLLLDLLLSFHSHDGYLMSEHLDWQKRRLLIGKYFSSRRQAITASGG